MASKSKSRRRVFRASCILAALIVAGSSFAWFTSKDEVTNRLSAKADYDVAIAEDFTPPENWIPGQKINKDVGAVNTGNVDAFVRAYLQGEMRILKTTPTNGVTVDNWDADNSKFVDATVGYFNISTTGNDVEDPDLINMGLTKFYQNGTTNPKYYFKTLSKTSTKNPNDNQQTNNQDDYNTLNNTDYYSEVQAMQAGGVLAYAPSDAEYTYVLNQEAELPIYSKEGASGTAASVVTRKVPAGTRVYVTAAATPSTNWLVDKKAPITANTVWVPAQAVAIGPATNADHFNPVNIDADSFQPLTPGLYLFARNVDLKADDNTANDYEFSGYYYSDFDTVVTESNGVSSMTHTQYKTGVGNDQTTTNSLGWVDSTTGKITAANGDYGKGTYYALKAENDINTGDNRSDYTVPNGKTGDATVKSAVTVTELDNDMWYVSPTSDLELFTANYTTIDSTQLQWRTTDDISGDKKVFAVYDAASGSADFDPKNDIAIEIGLNNIGTANNQWTPINTAATVTGYTLGTVDASTDASKLTFYYNDDVESGDTTEKFVDYVKLCDIVTNDAYLAFDFDLNVFMDSVQVTYAENGNELTTPVEAGGVWDNTTNTAVTGAKATAQDAAEVGTIAWTATT